MERLNAILLIAAVNLSSVLVAQEVQTDGGLSLQTSDNPTLVPEPLFEPAYIPFDSVPMLDQPTLFPRDKTQPNVRLAIPVERNGSDEIASNETSFDAAANGAASAFGFNYGAGSLTRPSIAGVQAEREQERIMARAARQSSLEHYNVKIGPIPFRFGAGVEFQFSDNVDLSKTNKLADLSVVPHVDMYGGIRLSPNNTLSIQLGIGYIWNLNRPELDRVLTNASVGLDSDSGISFDIKVGGFRINIHERPAIPRQQFDLITQRNALQYSQFTNMAGVTIFWDVNSRLNATLQYDHLNVISLRSEVENLDQSSELLSASATYQVNDAISIGIQTSASLINYKRKFLNESKNYDAGLTFAARASHNVILRIIAGYQLGDFGSGGSIGDATDLRDWYFRISVTHSINRYLNHSMSFGHESQVGTASNSTEVDYFRHQVNVPLLRTLGLGTIFSIDSAKESGGTFAQDFKLFQVGVFWHWTFSKKASLLFSYRFVRRDASLKEDSSDDSLDYIENRFDLGIQVSL